VLLDPLFHLRPDVFNSVHVYVSTANIALTSVSNCKNYRTGAWLSLPADIHLANLLPRNESLYRITSTLSKHSRQILVWPLSYNVPHLLSHIFVRRNQCEKLTHVIASYGLDKLAMTSLPRRVVSSSWRTLVMSAGLCGRSQAYHAFHFDPRTLSSSCRWLISSGNFCNPRAAAVSGQVGALFYTVFRIGRYVLE
jgi:hypothetical protein